MLVIVHYTTAPLSCLQTIQDTIITKHITTLFTSSSPYSLNLTHHVFGNGYGFGHGFDIGTGNGYTR